MGANNQNSLVDEKKGTLDLNHILTLLLFMFSILGKLQLLG